ncbi:MAG: nitrous oxide reductase accessory protein NosL [Thermodesulfobacteriota bacterium]
MKKNKSFYLMAIGFVILWINLFIFFSFNIEAKEEPRWCPLCSMNLKMYHQTSNRLTLSDGTKVQTCSIFCAAQVYEKKPAEVDQWEVVDYETKKWIDAKKGHWLIGSDIPGVMTAVGKIAFLSLDDAKKYQQKHGGTIGTFDDALNRTLSDMGSDRKMIMAKVTNMAKMGKDLAGKQGCYKCHGEEGKGGSASGWNTPAFSKKMDSRVKIKEAIVKGVPGMPGYEGKIDEKGLHSITLYIWSLRPTK